MSVQELCACRMWHSRRKDVQEDSFSSPLVSASCLVASSAASAASSSIFSSSSDSGTSYRGLSVYHTVARSHASNSRQSCQHPEPLLRCWKCHVLRRRRTLAQAPTERCQYIIQLFAVLQVTYQSLEDFPDRGATFVDLVLVVLGVDLGLLLLLGLRGDLQTAISILYRSLQSWKQLTSDPRIALTMASASASKLVWSSSIISGARAGQ
jgi:hypothetical protein